LRFPARLAEPFYTQRVQMRAERERGLQASDPLLRNLLVPSRGTQGARSNTCSPTCGGSPPPTSTPAPPAPIPPWN